MLQFVSYSMKSFEVSSSLSSFKSILDVFKNTSASESDYLGLINLVLGGIMRHHDEIWRCLGNVWKWRNVTSTKQWISLSRESALMERRSLVSLLENGTLYRQQWNFIRCSPSLLHLWASCTGLKFICAYKFSRVSRDILCCCCCCWSCVCWAERSRAVFESVADFYFCFLPLFLKKWKPCCSRLGRQRVYFQNKMWKLLTVLSQIPLDALLFVFLAFSSSSYL